MLKSLSASVAKYRGNIDSSNALIEATDQARYRAIHQGCNRLVHFQAEQGKRGGSK